MARPRKQIDEKAVEALASCGGTLEEIAAKLDCSVDTLSRRFADTIKRGREIGRISLRGKQYEKAMKGDTGLLIWLGKQMLGQRDKSEINLTTFSDEELEAEVRRRIAAAAGSMAGDPQA